MIQASLHGKIPTILQNSEDVLTSIVFGMLQYLSHSELLLKVLSDSINLDRETLNLSLSSTVVVRYIFWPRLANSELDLLVVVEDNKDQHIIGIEAKYFSDKSSIEDESVELHERTNAQRDQLAREIEDLYEDSTCRYLEIERADIKSRTMIYLTYENDMPVDDLEQSLASIKADNDWTFERGQLYWLSWKSFYPHLINAIPRNKQDQRLIADLVKFFEKRNLKGFTGFCLVYTNQMKWEYKPLKAEHKVDRKLIWALGNVPQANWNYKGGNSDGQ